MQIKCYAFKSSCIVRTLIINSCGLLMKTINLDSRKKYLGTLMAVAEGLWSGVVVSGVLVISAFLIKSVWLF